MHDHINSYNPQMCSYPQMKLVYSAMIQENTSRDEPLAPPIIIVQDDSSSDPDSTDSSTAITPPWEFYYTNEMLLGRSVPPPSRINLTGCDCLGGQCHLNKSQCTCYLKQESFTAGYGVTGFMYHSNANDNQTLKSNGLPVFECNSLCACGEQCTNRVVSRGRIYSGESLGHEESEERALKYDEFGEGNDDDINDNDVDEVANGVGSVDNESDPGV
ncbi:hypothetical protein DFJ43DRAFT_1041570 [Lentinula guzmanii]|uniref:Pre-SET domain-containing protein n=1 Tax=Lentinula guzmanii TaxID=2804957 RepID=A0AA38JEX9_9AGAR|nr:hypothetical protein DFJ43DRAFT_1041570 [Lentinula guzmanii]KAJ3797366.1 hypothetical protein GGU11DRAFT_826100 [Lentinula aff. detonsa]